MLSRAHTDVNSLGRARYLSRAGTPLQDRACCVRRHDFNLDGATDGMRRTLRPDPFIDAASHRDHVLIADDKTRTPLNVLAQRGGESSEGNQEEEFRHAQILLSNHAR